MTLIVYWFFLSCDLCTAFDHLAEQCTYLIHTRGYEAWAL